MPALAIPEARDFISVWYSAVSPAQSETLGDCVKILIFAS